MLVLWFTVMSVSYLFRQSWNGQRPKMKDNENGQGDGNEEHPRNPKIADDQTTENGGTQKSDAIGSANESIRLVPLFFRYKDSHQCRDGNPAQVSSNRAEECQHNKYPKVDTASIFKDITRCRNKNEAGKDI